MTSTGGSRRSRPDTRFLLVLVALFSLFAAACSSTTETNTAGSDFVQRTPPTDPSDLPAPSDDPLVKLPYDDSGIAGIANTPGTAVLAAALAQTDEQSYSFDMGMNINMNMMGMEMAMAPDGPIMSGAVSGERMYAVTDVGAFMAGTTVTDENGEVMPIPDLGAFGDLRFEMWLDGTIMTIDMSGMASLDPSISGPAADGPVSFDLAELDDVDLEDIATEMLDGTAATMDPATAADLLRNLDSVVAVGSDEVAGRAVTVYRGALSMADYADALGEDMSELGGDFLGAGDLGAMSDDLDELTVDLTVMIDDDDLLRRMEVYVDMGPLMQSMFAAEPAAGDTVADRSTDGELDEFGEAFEEAMLSVFADLTMTMDMWMEFDGYGDSVVGTAPPAVNLTDDFDSVFDSIAA